MKILKSALASPEKRARLALYSGFAFNIVYAAFKMITGIVYRSVWFGAVALYYLLLCTIKFLLIRTDRRFILKQHNQSIRIWALKSFRRCGGLLMLLNLSMAVIVIFIVKYDKTADYKGFLLWIFGGYTLVRTVISAHDIKRLHHTHDPLLSASKHLGISVTLMSIFSLQTALLDRFCENAFQRQLINGTVGFAVCITVIIIAVSMIVSASRRLKEISEE